MGKESAPWMMTAAKLAVVRTVSSQRQVEAVGRHTCVVQAYLKHTPRLLNILSEDLCFFLHTSLLRVEVFLRGVAAGR